MRGADWAGFAGQAALGLALVCAQRLHAFRDTLRTGHLRRMVLRLLIGRLPNDVSGQLVNVYVSGLSSLESPCVVIEGMTRAATQRREGSFVVTCKQQ